LAPVLKSNRQPRCMNTYQTRDRWTAGKTETVVFHPYGGWLLYPPYAQGPTITYTFDVYPYREYFEAYTPNSSRDRLTFKAFSHYKCWTKVPAVYGGETTEKGWVGNTASHVTAQLNYSGTLPDTVPATPHHMGVHKDPYFGWLPGKCALGDPANPTLGLVQLFSPNEAGSGFVPVPECLSELTSAALKAMIPEVRSKCSLVNSIIELKDSRRSEKLSRESRRCSVSSCTGSCSREGS